MDKPNKNNGISLYSNLCVFIMIMIIIMIIISYECNSTYSMKEIPHLAGGDNYDVKQDLLYQLASIPSIDPSFIQTYRITS